MSDVEVASYNSRLPVPLQELKNECELLAHTPAGDTQGMASLLSKMALNYYQDVRSQAQQSFYSALAAAGIGSLFFIYAVWAQIKDPAGSSRINVSLLAGALIEVISGINFYLYFRAARQFAMFHICLERTNRFLLANTLCENLTCTAKRDEMRAELVRVVAEAPMLTLESVSENQWRVKPSKDRTRQDHPRSEGASSQPSKR